MGGEDKEAGYTAGQLVNGVFDENFERRAASLRAIT